MKRIILMAFWAWVWLCSWLSCAHGDDLGTYRIDEYLNIPASTTRFSTGAAYQPTALTYSIYVDGSTTGIVEDVDMVPASPFDGVTGAYMARTQLTTAGGYAANKHYVVLVKATVDGVSAVAMHTFRIETAPSTAADVVTALGTGSTLTALATATDLATTDGKVDDILEDTGTTIPAAIDAVPTTAETTAAIWAKTVDGKTFESLMEILLAFTSGKVVVTPGTGSRTISYYKADGTTIKLTITADTTYGGRAAGGSIDP